MMPDQGKSSIASASTRTNPFRRNRNVTPLAQENARRQGAISALAFQLLGGRDAALDFLNTEDAILSGRPIAIATLAMPASSGNFARGPLFGMRPMEADREGANHIVRCWFEWEIDGLA
jgi:hypothetical protein